MLKDLLTFFWRAAVIQDKHYRRALRDAATAARAARVAAAEARAAARGGGR